MLVLNRVYVYKSVSQRQRKWRGKCFHTPRLRAVFLQVSELALSRPAGLLVLSFGGPVRQLNPPGLHTFTSSVCPLPPQITLTFMIVPFV